MGNSLGGLIAVELAENHPGEFDGVVTLNGMVGGTKAQLDYVGNVRILFDFLYPGVLPGSVCDVPEDFDLTYDVIYPVVGAVQADPQGLGIISRLKQSALPGRNGEELVESLVTAIGFNFRGIHDVLDRTGGACPIDNMETVYEPIMPGLLPPEVVAGINAYIPRYDRSIPTDELFDRYYEPTGELRIPMIAVHNAYDPVVPLFHEHLYAGKVAEMGYSQNLELRVVDRYGHTLFGAEPAADEAAQALLDLRTKALAGGAVFAQ
jgi:pimeloyl-ACP methyl ester carboxylesterase